MEKMKRSKIFMLAASLLFSAFFALAAGKSVKAVVPDPRIEQLVQSNTTSTSIGISWVVVYTDRVEVWIKEALPVNKQEYRRVAVTTGNSYEIGGLKSGTTYDIMICAIGGTGAEQKKTYKTLYSAKTSLGEMNRVYQISWDRFTNTLEVGWDKLLTADGYEIYFETSDEKKTLKKETVGRDVNTASFLIKNNQSYKFSVRAFVTTNGVKSYTAWHSIICIEQPWVKSAVKKGGKLTVKWQKVKGATGYDVYVSDKPLKGYVKIKSVKGSASSLTLRKVGKKKVKKKKAWYVYVVAKRGGNTSGRKYYFNSADNGASYTAFS